MKVKTSNKPMLHHPNLIQTPFSFSLIGNSESITNFYRSHAIGLCLVWPTGEKEYEIKYLCSIPSHRGKGVEECLLMLALRYCANKGATKVHIKFDEEPIREY